MSTKCKLHSTCVYPASLHTAGFSWAQLHASFPHLVIHLSPLPAIRQQRVRDSGCMVLHKKLQPLSCQSAVNKPYPSMTWCGSCCRVAVCMFASPGSSTTKFHLRENRFHKACHGKSSRAARSVFHYVSCSAETGQCSSGALRNSQPHPLIVMGGFPSVFVRNVSCFQTISASLHIFKDAICVVS